MLMNYLKNITLALLFCSSYSYAEEIPVEVPSDTIALDEIEITANRLINFTTGAKVQRINSTDIIPYNTSNLSELLSEITSISIKSYGISGVSSISLRGMSSKHTAVTWNGFNLQSSMNGGVDLSALPAFLIDEIDVQFGGASALFGSGAIGGIVHLNNNLKFDNKLTVQYNQCYGSFDNYFEGLKFNLSNDHLASSTRIYHKSAVNDFEYVNTQQFGKPTVKQENSGITQYGLLQSNSFKLKNNQKISTNIWAQHHYLEIPSMMTSSISEQNQNTDMLRLSANWNINKEITSWFTRFYYNFESLVYEDPLLPLISEMENSSFTGEIENKTSIGNHFLLNAGINHMYDIAKTKNYSDDHFRNRSAIYSSLKYFNTAKTLAAIVSIREELVDNHFAPFTFSFSSRYQINSFSMNTNISKNYNLPTFNDLYWALGGNPDLKSENGWSEDLGLNFEHSFLKNHLNFEISAFNINLDNHVIWLPTSSSYWTAENVEKLWSRGFETGLTYSYKNTDFIFSTRFMYSYTKSTYERSENTEEGSIGKQLMYVPVHNGNAEFRLSYKWLNISYMHNYVGRRYITKDNTGYVEPYQLANLVLGGLLKLKTSELNVNLKINNIWNETYEVMAFYAMPLRYYSISLTYNFNKQIN
ncbi:MAG TPA: hypothetical protein DCG75_10535 [Bacteroidales bacterium]|nr:hypothetical protein [Bacteroidales bacterium]